MKIIIDNGHGADTPGKRSPVWKDGSQLFEFSFNRDIAQRVMSGLAARNIDAFLVTPEAYDISLAERTRRVNKLAKKESCFLISIHGNAGGGSGWEIFTSPGQTKSDEYATIIFNEVAARTNWKLRKNTLDSDPDKEADFYILKHTACPAVLTENLFMDYEPDCRIMLSEAGRRLIADIHIRSIIKILQL